MKNNIFFIYKVYLKIMMQTYIIKFDENSNSKQ